MRYFTLNNVDSRVHGYVLSIERSILPELDPIQISIPRKAGVYIPKKRSREVSALSFSIRFGIVEGSRVNFRSKVREIAQWIFNANKDGEAAPLVFSDEPARIYYAWITGSTDLEEFEATGETTIDFIIPDPYGYETFLSSATLETKGKNLVPLGYHNFDAMATGAFLTSTIAVIDTAHARSGANALKINMQSTDNNFVYLGGSSTDYNITVVGGRTYIFSWYSYGDVSIKVQGHVKFNTAEIQTLYSSTQKTIPSVEWTRHFMIVTAPADATAALLRLDIDQAWANAWFDDLQIEESTAGQTLPTEYKPPESAAIAKQIRNNGTAATFPRLRITPTTDLTFIKITNGKGDQILLNNRTFTAWTIIIVDFAAGDIFFEATGNSLMNWLTIDSRFFKLEPEEDYMITVEVNSGGTVATYLTWQQKYL